ncbi:MAG: P-loop NTPase fold protein [Pseudomonadota bacterium]|nr:P-loop NTPase fold protein [Pseudomonadota bacterium]
MNNDAPGTHDAFNRRSFAQNLAHSVASPYHAAGGLVVAIDGAWGSGKSTLLGWVKEELQAIEPAPVVLDFNPWRISGLDALIETFLIELAARLDVSLPGKDAAKGIEAGKRIVDYLRLLRHLKHLKYVPGLVGQIAGAVAGVAEQATKAGDELVADLRQSLEKSKGVEGAKAAVEQALDALGQSVVVILDDLDRLNREEIRTVFQLIKSVADFRHVTYLLAFDAGQVARALSETGDEGSAYLEKIVQVSYRIPPMFPWQATRFADATLKQVLRDIERELLPFEAALWDEAIGLAAALAKHPRHIVRLSNHLRLSWQATKGAVNACDVLVFEAMAQAFPELARVVRENPDEFTGVRFSGAWSGADFDWGEWLGDEKLQERWKRHLPEGIGQQQLAEKACTFLFPYTNKTRNEQASAHWRIADTEKLARLLQGCGLEDVPDAGDFHALFADPPAMQTTLAGLDAEGWKSWLRYATRYVPAIQMQNPEAVLSVLAQFSAQMDSEGLLDSHLNRRFINLILEILVTQPVTARPAVAMKLIESAPLFISAECLSSDGRSGRIWAQKLGEGYEPGDAPLVLDKALLSQAIGMWKNKAQQLYDQGLLIQQPKLHDVLFLWARLGERVDYGPVWAAVEHLCETREGLERFLSKYANDALPSSIDEFGLVWDADALLARIQEYPDLASACPRFVADLTDENVREHLRKLRVVVPPEP